MFVIALQDRRRYIERVMKELGISEHVSFVDAFKISGHLMNDSLSLEVREGMVSRGIFPEDGVLGFRVSRWKHIGCWISHINTFELILERYRDGLLSEDAPILIMEDDIEWLQYSVFARMAHQMLSELEELDAVRKCEMVNLGRCWSDCDIDSEFNKVAASKYLVNLSVAGMSCTHSYILRDVSVVHKLLKHEFTLIPREDIVYPAMFQRIERRIWSNLHCVRW